MTKRKDLHVITEPYDPNKLKSGELYVFLKEMPTPSKWGKDDITVTKEDLHHLETGKYKLWFSDGEYAHEIYLKEGEEE